MTKFAVLSHILPPSPSGQAMVLEQLLAGFDPDFYCLISVKQYETHDHAAKYYHLGAATEPSLAATRIHTVKRAILPRLPSPLAWVYTRAHLVKKAISPSYPNYNAATNARAAQIVQVIKREGCKLLIAGTGDLYDLPAGYRASKQTGIAFVPYIFDYYAYQWTGKMGDFAYQQEPVAIKGASKVIVPNEYMAAVYKKRYGVESIIIRNPSKLPDIAVLDQAEHVFNKDTINIVYTGAVYHAQFDAFRNLIAAIKRLNNDSFKIKLHIFTSQPPTWLEIEGIKGSDVVFHKHVSHTDVAKIQRQADVLFLPLAFESPVPEVIKTSAPGKMGEYLAVGRPILVHAPADSFVSWYFREHECGVVADVNDPVILGQILGELLDDQNIQIQLGQYAREQAAEDFNVERIRKQFVNLVEAKDL